MCVPSGFKENGQTTVWLYSSEDIEKMKVVASEMRAGRPPNQQEAE